MLRVIGGASTDKMYNKLGLEFLNQGVGSENFVNYKRSLNNLRICLT